MPSSAIHRSPLWHRLVGYCLLTPLLLLSVSGSTAHASVIAFLVKDIRPGSYSSMVQTREQGLYAVARNLLFFIAEDDTYGLALWRSDGTTVGTAPVIADVQVPRPIAFGSLIAIADLVFFSGCDNTHGCELWRSDGTATGTLLVADLYPGLESPGIPNQASPQSLTNVNGTLFFTARDPLGTGVWKTDGTPTGTLLVKRDSRGDREITNLTNVHGRLFYTVFGDARSNELWTSDGTPEGTRLVMAFARHPDTDGATVVRSLTSAKQQLFFVAYTPGRGFELWKSNGTSLGTVRVSETGPNTVELNSTWFLKEINGTLFVLTDELVWPARLWKSNGTAADTMLVKEMPELSADPPIWIGRQEPPVKNLVNVQGMLLFPMNNPAWWYNIGPKPGLWRTDGTPAGTVLVTEGLEIGLSSSLCGTAFFSTRDQLWQSAGTASSTILIHQANPGGAQEGGMPPYTQPLARAGGLFFFTADDGVHGNELWALRLSTVPGETPQLSHHRFLPLVAGGSACEEQ
jgi:ELWxxDGT repeat protein